MNIKELELEELDCVNGGLDSAGKIIKMCDADLETRRPRKYMDMDMLKATEDMVSLDSFRVIKRKVVYSANLEAGPADLRFQDILPGDK